MSLRFLSLVLLATLSIPGFTRDLRVCADPDNLPYSRRDGSGFENRIAGIVADELAAKLVYTWHPQQRAFVRKTIGADLCDVWMGVPSDFERVLTTKPYYRSSYVFVFAKGRALTSFEQANLPQLKIGVQLPGDDLAATPPGHALALRGAVDNVVGYTIFGEGTAAERIVDAIAKGRLDAGVVWGPQAGFFAMKRHLELASAKAPAELSMPFEFSISMGVKHGQPALRDELDAVIERRRGDIDAVLTEYAVPLVR